MLPNLRCIMQLSQTLMHPAILSDSIPLQSAKLHMLILRSTPERRVRLHLSSRIPAPARQSVAIVAHPRGCHLPFHLLPLLALCAWPHEHSCCAACGRHFCSQSPCAAAGQSSQMSWAGGRPATSCGSETAGPSLWAKLGKPKAGPGMGWRELVQWFGCPCTCCRPVKRLDQSVCVFQAHHGFEPA